MLLSISAGQRQPLLTAAASTRAKNLGPVENEHIVVTSSHRHFLLMLSNVTISQLFPRTATSA